MTKHFRRIGNVYHGSHLRDITLRHDDLNDLTYLQLLDTKIDHTVSTSYGINIDLDENGQVVGVEIL